MSETVILCELDGHQPVLGRATNTTTPEPITCGCGAETYEYFDHPPSGQRVLVNTTHLPARANEETR